MAEEVRDGFAIVSPPDGLSQNHGDVDDLRRGKETTEEKHQLLPEGPPTFAWSYLSNITTSIFFFKKNPHYLDFRAVFHLVFLGDCICDYNRLEASIVDAGNGWPRKDPVSQNGINFGGSSRKQPRVEGRQKTRLALLERESLGFFSKACWATDSPAH